MVEHESSIQINLNESIGKVNPFVLGQFIEHFPNIVIPRPFEVNVSGKEFKISFPKHSLSVLLLEK